MTMTEYPPAGSGGMDFATLERMLSVGGPALRPRLLDQLGLDFERLRGELASEQPAQLKAAAHELKGVSSTVGARALADLAGSLDQALGEGARTASDPVVQALLPPLRQHLDDLLDLLRDIATPPRGPGSGLRGRNGAAALTGFKTQETEAG